MDKDKNIDMDEVFGKVKGMAGAAAKEASRAAKSGAKKAAESTKKASEAAKKNLRRMSVTETFIQYSGREFRESDILDKVENVYKEQGHRLSAIKSMQIYIKPEENAAYYVINKKHTGKVDLNDLARTED